MEHKVDSRARRDGWMVKCLCGKSWDGWRWLCEEQLADHLMLNDVQTDTWGGFHNHNNYIAGAPSE